MANLNFDATNVAPDTGQLDPIPAGWYNAMMDESDIKPTKAEGGYFLECRFNILDGQYIGRKLFARFNIRNANPIAQEIGFKQLSAVAHAVNVLQAGDSQQYHGIPLKVRVKIRPAQGEYEANNEITSYKNINDPTAVSPSNVGGGVAAIASNVNAPVAPQAPQGWGPPPGAAPVSAPPQPSPPWAPPQHAAAPAAPQAGANPWPVQPTAAPAAPWAAPAGAQPWANPPPAQQQPAAPAAPAQQAAPQGYDPNAVPPWQRR